jgi:peroxin-14
MAIREDLVSSAVQFLADPAVQQSPVTKRVAFLESKGLNSEEIDEALRRANNVSSSSSSPSQHPPPVPAQPGYIAQQRTQPPRLPERDWRDWFIMAVVSGGVGYGMYFLAKVGLTKSKFSILKLTFSSDM